MNPEIFAEFLARQGHHIVKTESCYWYNAQRGFYFYFPYHHFVNPNAGELKKVLYGRRCIGMRYFTPIDCVGKLSYIIVCSDEKYDLHSLHKKSRNQTRRGLERFKIKQFSISELAILGNNLYIDTLLRQGRNPKIWDEHRWRFYCEAAKGLNGFEAWGAFTDRKLVSFIMGFQMEDHFTFLHQSSATAQIHLYPNNALVFSVTKLKLASPEVNAVSYGPESLDAPESLDIFKFRMGFQKILMKQRIVFNPFVKPFVGSTLHKCVQIISKARPKSDIFRKLEGIIRFYRDAT